MNIKYIQPAENIHDAIQNVYLVSQDSKYLLNELIMLHRINQKELTMKIDGPYIVVQSVSANNQFQFKKLAK